ncbi:cupin domain-containing protein [Hymenobacter weizhouensis]|uniref:cupin domain-containing protein n=1 Tax=Hymenobacter sp. YIM 151500-1 TaxID=2987689 RepID=UPI002226A872|nr:cupin domain-containing protein [Hymenobacter sp. YIM 151500-1]UYZ63909.1 cupin domain-containing protein [Hymenobacter sp. YIM 151500-1]
MHSSILGAENIRVVSSVRDNAPHSELIMYVAPRYRTPKHFHDLFTETFEVLEGELEFGYGRKKQLLRAGQRVVVERGVVHYFANPTDQPATIRVTISPGNLDFERGFRIYHGLAQDGQVDKKQNPKQFADTALFLKLTNSRFPGLGRLLEPLFFRAARKAIQNGRLAELQARYGAS